MQYAARRIGASRKRPVDCRCPAPLRTLGCGGNIRLRHQDGGMAGQRLPTRLQFRPELVPVPITVTQERSFKNAVLENVGVEHPGTSCPQFQGPRHWRRTINRCASTQLERGARQSDSLQHVSARPDGAQQDYCFARQHSDPCRSATRPVNHRSGLRHICFPDVRARGRHVNLQRAPEKEEEDRRNQCSPPITPPARQERRSRRA